MTRSKEALGRSQVTTSTFTFSYDGWAKIANRIGEIDLHAFSDPARTTLEHVRDHFSMDDFIDPHLLTVLLKAPDGLVIGYSQAEQYWFKTRARIIRTALLPQYQGQGLVGPLMDRMEEELRALGATEMERSVRVENGYADAIRRHYAARIRADNPVGKYTDGSTQFFIIDL